MCWNQSVTVKKMQEQELSVKAETGFSLADDLFNKRTVTELASRLAPASPGFNKAAFVRRVTSKFGEQELKERIHWIVTVLADYLPSRFPAALKVLTAALPAPLDPTRSDDDFGHFIWVVPGEYVARHGCTSAYCERSLQFLREATKRFSSEFAIRPFLKSFPQQTLTFLADCASDDNYHVRRLASEGLRPYLPWGLRVVLPPEDILPVLDQLHADPTRFVTRSVCNTLNDLSRTHPDLVVARLKQWQYQARQQSSEMDWMTRHALRTLLKQDHPPAMSLVGYSLEPAFTIRRLKVSKTVYVGEHFEWQCELVSRTRQKLRVTLRIDYLKANGSHTTKVFVVRDGVFSASEVCRIEKRQAFKPMTTRTLYPGTHYAQLVVNGVPGKRSRFELKLPDASTGSQRPPAKPA